MAGDLNFKVNFDTQQAGNEILALLQKWQAGSEEAGNKLNRALGGTTERKLVIRTVRDASGVKQLQSELVSIRSEADKLKKAFSDAVKVQPGSLTNIRQQLNQAKQARDEINQFGKTIDLTNRKSVISAEQTRQWLDADAKVKQLTASLKNLESADKGFGGRLADSFSRFLAIGNKLQDIVTIFQSINIAAGAITAPIKNATNALADLDAFALTFKSIGQGAGTASMALNESTRIALGLGVSVKTVREGFQQLSPVILSTGGTMSDVSAVTEALSSRFAAFGLSADKSRRVLNGVIQAFAKGKLQAEELTQQISEADPAFKTDLANAIKEVRDDFGNLILKTDGSTKALEGAVKSGLLTADVLRRVIPLLSKSEILFGKLGPTATTAVEALKKGNVTLNQVRGNFESLNQLNLESFANLARPIVASFLEIQATIIDFVTTVSKLQVTKDLISIFTQISQAISNLIKFLASGVEAFLRLAGVVTPIIKALLSIPGAAELVGVAIIASVIKPAKQAIDTFKGLNAAITSLAKANLPQSTIKGTVLDPKQAEVSKRSLDALRKELEQPVSSGYVKELDNITKAASTADSAGQDLTKKQKKQLKSLSSDLEGLTAQYTAQTAKLGQLQQSLTASAGQSSSKSIGSQNITAIKAQITQLEQLRTETRASATQLALTFIPMQDELKKTGQAWRTSSDEGAAAVRKMVTEYHVLLERVTDIDVEIRTLEKALASIGSMDIDPNITIEDNIKKSIKTAQTELEVLKGSIKNTYKQMEAILGTPVQTKLMLPTGQVDELVNLTKNYESAALNAYANVQSGSDKYIQNLTQERAALIDRQNLLKDILDNQRKLGEFSVPGLGSVRTEYEQVTAAIEKADKELIVAKQGFIDASRSAADYTQGLTALSQGQALSVDQLNAFKKAASINAVALKEARDAVSALKIEESALLDKQRDLTAALSKPQTTNQYNILKTSLKETQAALEALQGKIQLNSSALKAFEERAAALGVIIKDFGKSDRLSALRNSFQTLAQSANGLIAIIGKAGTGLTDFAVKNIKNIKMLAQSMAEFGAQIAIFAAIAVAMSAYTKATETARNVQEQNRAQLEALKGTADSLKKSLEDAVGKTGQAAGLDELVPKVSGVNTVLISLGNILKSITDAFSKLFSIISGVTFDPIKNSFVETGNSAQQLAGILGSTLAGALAGFLVSGLNPVGAAIGATVGLIAGLTAALNGNAVSIEEAKKKYVALREEYGKQYGVLTSTINILKQYKAAIDSVKQDVASGKLTPEAGLAKEGALIGQATAGIKNLTAAFTKLKNERAGVESSLAGVSEQVKRLGIETAQLKAKENALQNKPIRSTEDIQNLVQTGEALKRKREELQRAQAAEDELRLTDAQLKQAEKDLQLQLDQLIAKFPGLTKEAILHGETISNVGDKYKQAKSDLENLDPSKYGPQFDALATSMGRTKAELEALESRAANRELVGYISELRKQLMKGEIPYSLENMNKLVQALENRIVKIDIQSPELPKVITNLLRAQANLAALDGKKATITIDIIEKGLKDGTLQKTPDIVEKLKAAYETAGKAMAVGSKEYEANLNRQKELSDMQRFDAMSLDELNKQISEKKMERETSNQERVHSKAMENLQAEQDKAMKDIDKRKNAVTSYYDSQIEALSNLGPAEQELKRLQKSELQVKAQAGGRDGLEARAQLERMDREEKIAALRKKKEEELAKLEEEKTKKQEEFQKAEKTLVDYRKTQEEEIAKIRQKSIDEEISKMEKYKNARASGQAAAGGKAGAAGGASGGGSAAGTSGGPVVMDIRAAGPAPAKQGYNDGKSYVSGYQQGVQETFPQVTVPQDNYDPYAKGAQDKTNYNSGFYNTGNQPTEASSQYQPYSQVDFNQQGTNDGKQYNQGFNNTVENNKPAQPPVVDVTKSAKAANNLSGTYNNLNQSATDISGSWQSIKGQTDAAATSTEGVATAATDSKTNITDMNTALTEFASNASTTAANLKTEMVGALDEADTKLQTVAQNIVKAFQRELTMTINVKVNKQGMWTGGPVFGGTAYTVNERGQEGFMNKFGNITPIKKPRFGTWRAPSDGFVIPADIFSQMNPKAPGTKINHSKPNVSSGSSGGNASKAMSAAFAQINGVNKAHNMLREEIAVSHAAQTLEIGKLTTAVRQLVDKNWNVDVNIKNSNNKTVAYLDTINRII